MVINIKNRIFRTIWYNRFSNHKDWKIFKVCGWNQCMVDDKFGQRWHLWFDIKWLQAGE